MTNYQHQFSKLTKSNAWLQDKRQQSFAHFEKVGFPNLRDEAWKYTNIRPLLKQEFIAPSITQTKANNLNLSELTMLNIPGCQNIIFINGQYFSENFNT